MATPSRGDSPSGYYPHFEGTSGIKSYLANLKAQVKTGTITSAAVTYSVTHQLGKTPTFIGITTRRSSAHANGMVSGFTVTLGLSAATSAVFYVNGTKAGLAYTAFLLV